MVQGAELKNDNQPKLRNPRRGLPIETRKITTLSPNDKDKKTQDRPFSHGGNVKDELNEFENRLAKYQAETTTKLQTNKTENRKIQSYHNFNQILYTDN